MKHVAEIKPQKLLKDLTLLDKFLFDETMDHPEIHEAVLQIILGQEQLKLLTPAQTEKELRTAPWLRSIRLDVYALDQESTIYNTEMQAERRTDLVKRSRYYQSLIDSSLLEPGTINFNLMNDACLIMITPFDLFGEGKYCYTFVPSCRESQNLELNDGTVRIFLNTKGTNDEAVSRELRDLLHYVESTDEAIAEDSGSERIKQIHACVSQIKASEKMGVKYMQKLEAELREKQKHEEALKEAVKEAQRESWESGYTEATISNLRKYMKKSHATAEEAMDCFDIPKDERDKYLKKLNE